MRVCLAIPSIGGVPSETAASHLALAAAIGRSHDVVVPSVFNVMPHARAREEVIRVALREACDVLMFVDSDMETPPDAFNKLSEGLSLAQMIVGHFYRRGYPFAPTWYKKHDGQIFQCTAQPDSGFHEIDSAGMACNLIDLHWCKEHMSRPWFFQGKVDGIPQDYVWEDSYFCWKLQECGGKILGDSRVRVGHLGPAIVVNDSTYQMLNRMWVQEHPEVI